MVIFLMSQASRKPVVRQWLDPCQIRAIMTKKETDFKTDEHRHIGKSELEKKRLVTRLTSGLLTFRICFDKYILVVVA